MANAKEIRVKIKSVQNTQKITKAMETVAASKMRRAQDMMRAARPYAERIRRVAVHLANSMIEYNHPFLAKPGKMARIGIILITSDKGLCGGLNTNQFRMLSAKLKDYQEENIEVNFTAFGAKGLDFLRRMGGSVISQAVSLGDRPKPERLIGPVKVMMDKFLKGELDGVFLCYSTFINTMKQEPIFEQLLPLPSEYVSADEQSYPAHNWEYIYEPNKESVLKDLFTRYVEHLIYQIVAENNASEQSARMVAMKAASDNADHMIARLQLKYNKTRQAAITTELTEIVSGAAAV